MEKDTKRQPFREVLLAFGALRGIELVTLVSAAAIFDAISAWAHGSVVQISLLVPLLAASTLYVSFGYVAVSATAFWLQWLFGRPGRIKFANSFPLLIWGLLALLVFFGTKVPAPLALALIFGVVVNWVAARAFEAIHWRKSS